MRKQLPLWGIIFLMLMTACSQSKKRAKAIAGIPMEVSVKRFDKQFAQVSEDNLHVLKGAYPYLFPTQFPDSVWLNMAKDSLQKELEQEVFALYDDFEPYEKELKSLFQHIQYYFPEFVPPTLVTLITEVDYNNSVIVADTLALIGLDNFLGSDHRFYEGIHRYISKTMEPEQLAPKLAEAYARQWAARPQKEHFLAGMVYYGKVLYLKERLLPEVPKHKIMGYTAEEWEWAQANESEIWRYFVENELLFSTDDHLPGRFLNPAPFSKFYLELDNESPGQLGRYVGWQIVRAYMNKHDIPLQELLSLPAEKLFDQSKFKPRK